MQFLYLFFFLSQESAAEYNEDYVFFGQRNITFGRNLLAGCFNILVVDDNILEDTETFTLTFTHEYSVCHSNKSLGMMSVIIKEDPSECEYLRIF